MRDNIKNNLCSRRGDGSTNVTLQRVGRKKAQKRPVFESTVLREAEPAGEFSISASLVGIDFFKGDCCFLIKNTERANCEIDSARCFS